MRPSSFPACLQVGEADGPNQVLAHWNLHCRSLYTDRAAEPIPGAVNRLNSPPPRIVNAENATEGVVVTDSASLTMDRVSSKEAAWAWNTSITHYRVPVGSD